jgi:CheY-like chemotaxis protein
MEAGGVAVEEGVMRVLLVDDSPVDRRVAQLLLSSNSCAGSFHGQPPLALTLSSPPDFFLTL